MTIECMKFKSVNKGYLVGFADLYLPKWGLEIFGCALYLKDSRRWISFPSKEYIDADGSQKYAPIIRFRNKTHMETFSRLAIEAIEKKCAEPQIIPEELSNEGVPF